MNECCTLCGGTLYDGPVPDSEAWCGYTDDEGQHFVAHIDCAESFGWRQVPVLVTASELLMR